MNLFSWGHTPWLLLCQTDIPLHQGVDKGTEHSFPFRILLEDTLFSVHKVKEYRSRWIKRTTQRPVTPYTQNRMLKSVYDGNPLSRW